MTAPGEARRLDRLSSGVARLDAVMDGGFPVQSVNILAGLPGTGKTVLALQALFAAARAGKRCLYVTTLSEPSLKLMRYMRLLEFFDQSVVDAHVLLHDLGTRLRARDLPGALEELTELVAREGPELVVIDSFKAIGDLQADARETRTFAYDLAVQMAGWGATTLLLGEYADEELRTCAEFAIADGIVVLSRARQELAQVRELQILKLRGSRFVTGVHFFEVSGAGIEFFPRVRGPEAEKATPAVAPSGPAPRLSSGVPAIDALLDGGIPAASTTLLVGGSGIGKTLLGLHFLVEGAKRGERGVLFTLEETPDQLRAVGDAFGFDLSGLEERGLIHIHYDAPVELSTDRFLVEARRITERWQAQRAVLDSLSSLALGAVSERRYKELVYALSKHFRRQGVTLLATMEVASLLGTAELSGHGLSFAADNVIQLRYFEMAGRLERALSVLKARGVNVNTELRPFRIGAQGASLGAATEFDGLAGVVTGLPRGTATPPGDP